MPRGIPKVRVPSTSPGVCIDCGRPVAVFSYGRRYGMPGSKRCAVCRQKNSRGFAEYAERKRVEELITARAGKG